MKYAIAQINPCLGDFPSNYAKITKLLDDSHNADIIIFPELAVSGYNPQDLLLSQDFIDQAKYYLNLIIEHSKNLEIAVVIGSIWQDIAGEKCHNSAFFIHKGKILHRHDKIFLPNYGIFDEQRVFKAGQKIESFQFKKTKIALLICEDLWNLPPIDNDTETILTLNASPFEIEKFQQRTSLLKEAVDKYQCNLIYCNQVGLQDSVIYDGNSLALNYSGALVASLKEFDEDLAVVRFEQQSINFEQQTESATIYHALVFALQEYLSKNNLNKVTLGFSGGIDSSLTAVIAIDAIGKENVKLITMPSRYTSPSTFDDANELLTLLETKAQNISIEEIFTSSLQSISKISKENSDLSNLTQQNMQARIRGLILMSVANEHGCLLLSTGNKSELATGYATLYGDMNGGYNLLKDLYKRDIYALATYRNSLGQAIPNSIITKAPTAELTHNQKDSDNLPDYEILDEILYCYIEKQMKKNDIINHMLTKKLSGIYDNNKMLELVDKILNLVRIAEFKRNQATLGPKIRNMSFDFDWRRPIINRFVP